jgi:hypothetical protein
MPSIMRCIGTLPGNRFGDLGRPVYPILKKRATAARTRRFGRHSRGASCRHARVLETMICHGGLSSASSTARPGPVNTNFAAWSRSTRFRTSKCWTVIVGTPALTQSVSDAKQSSRTRCGTVRLAAMVSAVGALTMVNFRASTVPAAWRR